MICRRNSELFKIHSQTLHHKLPLSHFQPHRRITLCPSPLFQFNSSKPIYNYESFLNRKLEFFTWAHFISQLLVWGNWLGERMITINNRVSNSAQKLVNITRPDIHRWLMKEFSIWSSFNNESPKSTRFRHHIKYFWNSRMIDLYMNYLPQGYVIIFLARFEIFLFLTSQLGQAVGQNSR